MSNEREYLDKIEELEKALAARDAKIAELNTEIAALNIRLNNTLLSKPAVTVPLSSRRGTEQKQADDK